MELWLYSHIPVQFLNELINIFLPTLESFSDTQPVQSKKENLRVERALMGRMEPSSLTQHTVKHPWSPH